MTAPQSAAEWRKWFKDHGDHLHACLTPERVSSVLAYMERLESMLAGAVAAAPLVAEMVRRGKRVADADAIHRESPAARIVSPESEPPEMGGNR